MDEGRELLGEWDSA